MKHYDSSGLDLSLTFAYCGNIPFFVFVVSDILHTFGYPNTIQKNGLVFASSGLKMKEDLVYPLSLIEWQSHSIVDFLMIFCFWRFYA